jgi:hypothetical protein
MMCAKKKNPTIYDVAEYSGTSIYTVSRVLNSPDKVSAEMRHKVIVAIDALGFVLKAEARARTMRLDGRIRKDGLTAFTLLAGPKIVPASTCWQINRSYFFNIFIRIKLGAAQGLRFTHYKFSE